MGSTSAETTELDWEPEAFSLVQDLKYVRAAMLGDGSIKRNFQFAIGHALNQLDWLRWKVERIAPELGKEHLIVGLQHEGGPAEIKGRKVVRQPQFHWQACNKELLQPLRELYYPPGRKLKLITPEIVESIDLEDFAWLVADDGSNGAGILRLESRLPEETAQALLARVETLIGLGRAGSVFCCKRGNKAHPGEAYYLGFSVAATCALREALTPYLPECVHYKLREITKEEREHRKEESKKYWAQVTPEQRLEVNRKQRERWAGLSAEKREQELERKRQRRANMTPEQRERQNMLKRQRRARKKEQANAA